MLLRLPFACGFVLLACFFGCDSPAPPGEPSEAPPAVSTPSRFDPSTAGTVRGRVTWAGDLPQVPPVRVNPLPTESAQAAGLTRRHPNAPAIDPSTRAVAGAVVFLRGIEPERSRPWDLGPVRVEMRDRWFHLRQGDDAVGVGFVRRGDAVEMVSRDPVFHALRADGAAFFTLAFPDADRPRRRRLEKKGLVELSSGAGHPWMRAYLFVDDHPYYTRTDAAGLFALAQVPPGRYEAVAWLPNWAEAGHSRDPESGLVTRIVLQPPVEHARPVEIPASGTAELSFTFSTGEFAQPAPH